MKATLGPVRALAFLVALTMLPGAGVQAADLCDAPEDITADIAPLPHVAASLKAGGSLNVLTVGSATVFSPSESLQPGTVTGQALGLGTGSREGTLPPAADTAFPLQMGHALEAAVPGLSVKVTVRGGRGMAATEMLDIIRGELASTHYDLVIWQTGTVEAVRNVPAGAFSQTLADGSAAVEAAGADLVLVDPQFSRFLHANADVDSYAQALQQASAQPGVVLFHRFDLMHHWSSTGQIDLERTPRAQRLATVEQLHACLGQALARFIAASARDTN